MDHWVVAASSLFAFSIGSALSWAIARKKSATQRGTVALLENSLAAKAREVEELRSQEAAAGEARVGGESASREQTIKRISDTFHRGSDMMEDIARNLQNIQSIVEKNAEPLNDIYQAGTHALQNSTESRKALENLRDSITHLTEVSQNLNWIRTQMDQVNEKSQIIHRIAKQAHLLSFNAAIEAARAGETGRGFGVVARDINRLSDISGNAAREINTILSETMDNIGTITGSVEEKVSLFSEVSQSVLDAFAQIDGSIQQIGEISNLLNRESLHTMNDVKALGETAKTSTESLTKMLAEVTGTISGTRIVDVRPSEVYSKLAEYEIIDVRRPEEFNDELGHIEGADLYTLQDRFKERLASLDRNKKYLFVCRSGGRSARAACVAQAMGFRQVSNLEGGMLEWRKHFPKGYVA